MSKLTDSLHSIGVSNDHGFFNEVGQVWIQYVAGDSGRGGRSGRAQVYRRGFKTDPDGPWYDYGRKTFNGWETPLPTDVTLRAHCLALAQAWAGERYGIAEWVRSPFGGYGDAVFVKRRLAELKARVKDVERERVA